MCRYQQHNQSHPNYLLDTLCSWLSSFTSRSLCAKTDSTKLGPCPQLTHKAQVSTEERANSAFFENMQMDKNKSKKIAISLVGKGK